MKDGRFSFLGSLTNGTQIIGNIKKGCWLCGSKVTKKYLYFFGLDRFASIQISDYI